MKIAALICLLCLLPGCAFMDGHKSRAELEGMSLAQLEQEFADHSSDYHQHQPYALTVRELALPQLPDWPEYVRDAVGGSRVINGMDQQQVFWAWGEPSHRTRDRSPYGTVERWYYGNPEVRGNRTVTFVAGRVQWWSVHD